MSLQLGHLKTENLASVLSDFQVHNQIPSEFLKLLLHMKYELFEIFQFHVQNQMKWKKFSDRLGFKDKIES